MTLMRLTPKPGFMGFFQAPAWVWIVALVPRFVLCALAAIDPKLVLRGDSTGYLALAENLIAHGVFSTDQAAPFIANTIRTPGYPIFLSFFTALHASIVWAAVVQSILGALSVVCLWNWLNRLGCGRGAVWAALMLAFDPVTVLNTPLISTEALFNFLLVSAAIMTWVELRTMESQLVRAATTGVLWSLAALVRPISLLLPLLLCWIWRRDKKKFLVFLAAAFLFPAIWVTRNHQATGFAVFSSIGGNALLRGPAASVESISTGKPWDELDEELRAQVDAQHPQGYASEAAQSNEYGKLGRRILRAHPFLLIRHCAGGVIRLWGGTGLEMFREWIPFRGGYDPSGVKPHAFVTGQGTLTLLRRDKWLIPVQIFYMLALATLYWSALGGLYFLWRQGRRGEMIFLSICIVYFTALSSGQASYRYRIPIIPFFAAAAAFKNRS